MNQLSMVEEIIRRTADIRGNLRLTLSRVWGNGSRVCWVMLNPSTADHKKDDPTIKRCIHFTKLWGYGGFVVVNLYPFRSSSPAECKKWANWEPSKDWGVRDDIYYHNQPIVVEHAKKSDLVVAAWGNNAWDLDYVDHLTDEIQSNEEPWPDIYCLGTTNSGSPKHPMARGKHRVPDDQQPILWKAA